MVITVAELLAEANLALRSAAADTPGLDARLLLEEAASIDQVKIISDPGRTLSDEQASLFRDYVKERCAGKPVHRILGYREFLGRRFEICDGVLEPRPDTELLVETVLADWQENRAGNFIEIGVGTGVVALSILAVRPLLKAVGTDTSKAALACASKNAKNMQLREKIKLANADLVSGISGTFDFVVSNPPYIPTSELPFLQEEVRLHDPQAALDGGADGLRVYDRIFATVRERLKENGRLYLEMGHNQLEELIALADKNGWEPIEVGKDLGGNNRVLVLH